MRGNDMMRFAMAALLCLMPLKGIAQKPSGGWGDLSKYRKTDRVWIGSAGGKVEVNPTTDLIAARYGSLTWKVEDGTTVKKGDVLVIQATEEYEHSSKQLALDEGQMEVNIATLKWEHREKTAAIKQSVNELASRLSGLDLTEPEKKLVGPELAERLEARRKELRADLESEKEKISPAFRAEVLELEMQQLRVDVAQARWDHEKLVEMLSIRAPHDGVVHHLKSGNVSSRDVIGHVERRGMAVAQFKVLDPDIRSEEPENLAVAVVGPRGESLKGTFSHVERYNGLNVGPKIYNFNLIETPETPLNSEMSGERMVSVYRLLDREAHLVDKSKFLFDDPEAIEKSGWRDYIKTIWPDAKIVYLGPDKIALTEDP